MVGISSCFLFKLGDRSPGFVVRFPGFGKRVPGFGDDVGVMFPHSLVTCRLNEGLFRGDGIGDSARGDRRGEVLLLVLWSSFRNEGYKEFVFFLFSDSCRMRVANNAISAAFSWSWFSFDLRIISGDVRAKRGPQTDSSSPAWGDKIRMRRRYNSIHFLQIPHKRHIWANPWGRGMGCLFGVHRR